MEHEEYLKRRDELLGIRMDSFSSFDKAILSLATGSLALSITFLEKIGEPFSGLTFALILIAWVAFFLVILFNLASYYFARANMDKKIADLDDRYRKELKTEKPDESPEPTFWQNRATSMCNTIAFVAFCTGVLFFVIYVVNIQARNYRQMQHSLTKEATMADTKKILTEGKTEAPQAASKTTHKVVLPGDVNTHGATEAPQAVLRPGKPSGGSGGGSKKSE
ncbi:hypothetical protein [uncultured Desulfosarcina sp.]|uniref:hypothetical protein n=1 Tax=uncultured Desulfosarcina sp. TaxID=218289 RepID=UPI0029C832DF|nr:hypothetical protein [uncultured Desulfosarcina sp.]